MMLCNITTLSPLSPPCLPRPALGPRAVSPSRAVTLGPAGVVGVPLVVLVGGVAFSAFLEAKSGKTCIIRGQQKRTSTIHGHTPIDILTAWPKACLTGRPVPEQEDPRGRINTRNTPETGRRKQSGESVPV